MRIPRGGRQGAVAARKPEWRDSGPLPAASVTGTACPGCRSALITGADSASEAVEALIALGYSSTEARNAISQIRDQADTPEDLIRLALRAMAGM